MNRGGFQEAQQKRAGRLERLSRDFSRCLVLRRERNLCPIMLGFVNVLGFPLKTRKLSLKIRTTTQESGLGFRTKDRTKIDPL